MRDQILYATEREDWHKREYISKIVTMLNILWFLFIQFCKRYWFVFLKYKFEEEEVKYLEQNQNAKKACLEKKSGPRD